MSIAIAAALLLLACQKDDDLGTPPHGGTGTELSITADTRAITADATINIKIGTDAAVSATIDKDKGTLTFADGKPTIAVGTKELNITAWGTVSYKDSKTGAELAMPVKHANTATPVTWSATTGPGIDLRLAAQTALIRLNVTNSDGTDITAGATMPQAKTAKWNDASMELVADAAVSFTANGLAQILPGTVDKDKTLFGIGTKTLKAQKGYNFVAGTEYTFNVRITTKGEAVLEEFSVKAMEEGAALGNGMIIRTIADLRTFRDRVNKGEKTLCAIQTADIVMEEEDKESENDIDGKGWVPIGNMNGYAGTYNGGGYSISGLTINSKEEYRGLFGYISATATLTAIRLKDVNVVGASNTGALVGLNSKGTISKCSVEGGSVSGGYWHTGALVGYNDSGTIVSCFSTASVKVADDRRVGGLVGENKEGTIAFCYATGSVEGGSEIGGLVGMNTGGTITSCYATGVVTATGRDKGSLVGSNNATITYCWNATQVVTGDGNSIEADKAGDTVRGNKDTSITIGSETFTAANTWEADVAVPRLQWQIPTTP